MYPSPLERVVGKLKSLIPNGSFETCPTLRLPHSGQRRRGRVYHRMVNTVPVNTKPMIKYEIISHPAAEEVGSDDGAEGHDLLPVGVCPTSKLGPLVPL